MPLVEKKVHEVERSIRLAARQMIQRVTNSIAVFLGGTGVRHQTCGTCGVPLSSKQPGEKPRAGGMPHEEAMETLCKRKRLLEWRTRDVQCKEPVNAGVIRRQLHERIDGFRRLLILTCRCQRRRESHTNDHVERILIDRA